MESESYLDTLVGRRQVVTGFGLLALGLGVELVLGPSIVEAAKKPAKPPPKKKPPRPPSWHDFSQEKRNGLILSEAFEDLYNPPRLNPYGKETECKGWVQKIVERASDGAVKVPLNIDNGYGDAWVGCPDKKLYVGRRSSGIYGVQMGDIIQMHYQTAKKQPDPINGYWIPHTTIVSRIIGSGFAMEWIDCNWLNNDRKVRKHTLTYETFFAKTRDVGLNYNVYYIL